VDPLSFYVKGIDKAYSSSLIAIAGQSCGMLSRDTSFGKFGNRLTLMPKAAKRGLCVIQGGKHRLPIIGKAFIKACFTSFDARETSAEIENIPLKSGAHIIRKGIGRSKAFGSWSNVFDISKQSNFRKHFCDRNTDH